MDRICPRTRSFVLCVWLREAHEMDRKRGWEMCRGIPRFIGVWLCLCCRRIESVDGFEGYFFWRGLRRQWQADVEKVYLFSSTL